MLVKGMTLAIKKPNERTHHTATTSSNLDKDQGSSILNGVYKICLSTIYNIATF